MEAPCGVSEEVERQHPLEAIPPQVHCQPQAALRGTAARQRPSPEVSHQGPHQPSHGVVGADVGTGCL